MSKFTSGRWEYKEYVPEGITLNGVEYLICSGDEEVALVRCEEDARLIEHAPRMYELLQESFLALSRVGEDEPLRLAIDECLCHIEGSLCPTDTEQA